jgi:hypothetical protein
MAPGNSRGPSFWKRLFKGRAQLTGRLPDPDIRQKLGWNQDDAKVSNSNPSEAFAVTLRVDLAHLFTLETAAAVTAYVVGRDDFGHPVTTIPISQTSSVIWFDFASSGLELPYEGQDVSLAKFVSNFCHALKDRMIPKREEFRYFLINRAEDLVLRRIAWFDSLKSWYPIFDNKSSGQGS